MDVAGFPPTQLYAALAFVLSVATLWLNRLDDDDRAREYMQAHFRATTMVVCTFLTLPILHVLYVLFAHSSATMWHQAVHATPLIAAMLAIIGWWMRTLAVTPTVGPEEGTPS